MIFCSLSKDTLDQVNVSSLSIFLRHTFLGLPRIPFTSGFETRHHTWLGDGVVSIASLFEKTVNFSFLGVVKVWLGISDLLSVGFELQVKNNIKFERAKLTSDILSNNYKNLKLIIF